MSIQRPGLPTFRLAQAAQPGASSHASPLLRQRKPVKDDTVLMPGFRHPPGADIQQTRQDLRDRYQNGFPVLKELLQNADDAGATLSGQTASQCVFTLFEEGLPNAQHGLFLSPGLAVINDGGFTADD